MLRGAWWLEAGGRCCELLLIARCAAAERLAGQTTLHVAHCLFCVVCCLRGPPRPARGSQVTGNLVT